MATLREKCILVRLRVKEFPNKKNDPALTRKLANLVKADPNALESKKTLLDCPAIKDLAKIKGDTRNNIVNRLGSVWEVGERIMANALMDQLEYEYAIAKQAWDDAKDSLRDQAEAAIERAKRRLGDAFNPDDYPSVEEIVGRFTMKLTYRRVPETEDFRIDNLSHDRNEKLRVDIQTDVDDCISDAMKSVEDRLVDTVSHLGEVCAKYGHDPKGKVIGRFKDSTVEKVTELAKLLPHLNITDDPRIAKAATELKAKLSNITPDKIKNSLGERERIVADTKSILDNLGGVYG
tara:strand:+ start:567 stop:1442 length:876 start_codon:yes stop_codon:yes gene_type:complete